MGKSINCFLLFLAAVLTLYSCESNSKETLNAFKLLDESLNSSNRQIQISCDEIYHSLQERIYDPANKEKAAVWTPRAKRIVDLSQDITNFIDSLINALKQQAGLRKIDGNEIFNQDNVSIVNGFFASNGNRLFTRLLNYKNEILASDSSFVVQFQKSIYVITAQHDGLKTETLADSFFYNIPVIAAISLLDRFKNNVKTIENRLLVFCYEHLPRYDHSYNECAALVAQSSTIVQNGEKIEITAGILSVDNRCSPEITIGKRKVAVDYDGTAKYVFRASQLGKYKIPVEIKYVDQNGVIMSKTKNVEYRVVDSIKRQ
jgi:gliding motility-associated protein GldM